MRVTRCTDSVVSSRPLSSVGHSANSTFLSKRDTGVGLGHQFLLEQLYFLASFNE